MRPAFTLIELLVVIGMAAVLLTVALPAFANFSGQILLSTSANSLVAQLRDLQSRAVLQHETLSFFSSQLKLPTGIRFERAITIRFSASGAAPPGGSGSLVLKNRFGQSRTIVVSSAGRVRVE